MKHWKRATAALLPVCIVLLTATGLSLASDAERSPTQRSRTILPTEGDPLVLQFSFDLEAAPGALGNAGSEYDGTYYYTTRWASDLIHQFDSDGNLIKEFTVPGVSGLRDLAWDGEYMYGGNAGFTVYQMDLISETLISSFSSPVGVRHIAYDAGADGFWVGNWADSPTLIDRSGSTLETLATGLSSQYGTAYDEYSDGGPYLWVFDQGGGQGSPQYIHQFDLNTLTATGYTHDVEADFGTFGIAGGLWVAEDVIPGTVSLGGLHQGTPDMLFVYELPVKAGCGFAISTQEERYAPGDVINFDVSIHHKREETAKVPINAWIQNTKRDIVASTVSKELTIHEGDFIDVEMEITLPSYIAPGRYTLFGSIGEMKQGTASARHRFIVESGVSDLQGGEAVQLKGIPEATQLGENYPNPFNPSTTINYGLSEDGWVSIKIFNSVGQEVATLVNEFQSAGFNSVVWNGTDNAGTTVASGIYLYRMTTQSFVETKKLLLMK